MAGWSRSLRRIAGVETFAGAARLDAFLARAHILVDALPLTAQTQNLLGQASEQVSAQATEQTQRLSQNIRQLAQHFSQMAGAGEPGSTAHSLVQTAAQHADRAAGYLDGKHPGQLVTDVQNLGRRRPGAFLFGAALAGIAVGRLAGAAKRATSDDSSTQPRATFPTPTDAPPVAEPYPPIRNVPPGAATIEPYPDATPGLGTL